jgi:hypothetical protein
MLPINAACSQGCGEGVQSAQLRPLDLCVRKDLAAGAELGARLRHGRVQPALENMVPEKRLVCTSADNRVPRSCGRVCVGGRCDLDCRLAYACVRARTPDARPQRLIILLFPHRIRRG